MPTPEYCKANTELSLEVFVQGSGKKIECDSVTIEDMSEEFGEQSIEITALLASSEEYEIYFSHYSEAYAQKFK